jgi:hypothetical protein
LIAYAEAVNTPRNKNDPLPELPQPLGYLWGWFLELSRARTEGQPITYPDIDAYSRLMDVRIQPWEAALIRRLDMEALAAPLRRKALEEQENAKPKKIGR